MFGEIKVLLQNNDLIAVEKPSGLLVHAYKKETNERNHLLRMLKQQTGLYLYPVHRLDRPVSGIVLFALSSEMARTIKNIWHDAATVKEYLALVRGRLEEPGRFDFPLFDSNKNKQSAVTEYQPLELFEDVTLMSIRIKTGRKHQIRRHFSRRWANVIGDSKYGQGKINQRFKEGFGLKRIFLHATRLKLILPTGDSLLDLSSPLPQELNSVLEQLRGDHSP